MTVTEGTRPGEMLSPKERGTVAYALRNEVVQRLSKNQNWLEALNERAFENPKNIFAEPIVFDVEGGFYKVGYFRAPILDGRHEVGMRRELLVTRHMHGVTETKDIEETLHLGYATNGEGFFTYSSGSFDRNHKSEAVGNTRSAEQTIREKFPEFFGDPDKALEEDETSTLPFGLGLPGPTRAGWADEVIDG